ncbi:hypothetical protein EVAR_5136_1 [Eumeta japonica]|uniref:Uncharacterized protein n=1 Tax=Eumeta variegata TaxID=151549 RepID=A0A4C1SV77_EUMVA|nr:hypothetical protein EVAR_5136_1 [Eumeta japonica]
MELEDGHRNSVIKRRNPIEFGLVFNDAKEGLASGPGEQANEILESRFKNSKRNTECCGRQAHGTRVQSMEQQIEYCAGGWSRAREAVGCGRTAPLTILFDSPRPEQGEPGRRNGSSPSI